MPDNETVSRDAVLEAMQGPDYFRCERMHATLRKKVCMGYQAEAKEDGPFAPGSRRSDRMLSCLDCKQGRMVAAGLRESRQTKDREAKDMAEIKQGKERKQAVNKGKLCRCGCGQPAVSRGLAKRCYDNWRGGARPELGEYTRAIKYRARNIVVKDVREANLIRKSRLQGKSVGDGLVLRLDLKDYPDILPALRESAVASFRSVENQAIAYLAAGLGTDGRPSHG